VWVRHQKSRWQSYGITTQQIPTKYRPLLELPALPQLHKLELSSTEISIHRSIHQSIKKSEIGPTAKLYYYVAGHSVPPNPCREGGIKKYSTQCSTPPICTYYIYQGNQAGSYKKGWLLHFHHSKIQFQLYRIRFPLSLLHGSSAKCAYY